jgi:hypothetical protein
MKTMLVRAKLTSHHIRRDLFIYLFILLLAKIRLLRTRVYICVKFSATPNVMNK